MCKFKFAKLCFKLNLHEPLLVVSNGIKSIGTELYRNFYPEHHKGSARQQYMGHWVCVGIFTLEGSSVVVWGLGRDRGERGAAAVSTNLGLRPCK